MKRVYFNALKLIDERIEKCLSMIQKSAQKEVSLYWVRKLYQAKCKRVKIIKRFYSQVTKI